MKSLIKLALPALASLLLVACGGGGSSEGGSFTTPTAVTVQVTAANLTMPSNRGGVPPRIGSQFDTEISVQVRRSDGTPVVNGTTVTISVGNSAVGRLWVPTDGTGDPGQTAPQLQTTVTVPTSAGVARAFFHTGTQTGTATITASVQDPGNPARTITGSVNINVVPGPEPVQRLVIEAQRTTLPANTRGVTPFLGSPFLTEVTVTWRRRDGSLAPEGQQISVSINPVMTSGAFSTLDNPDTPDNEFEILRGQGAVNVVAGRATLFFHSLALPGTTTMTVTAQDPDTNETISATQQFTVTAAAPPLPASVSLSDSGQPVYITGSGGNSTRAVQIFVADGSGNPVPDPVAGNTRFNNVRVELIPQGPAGGESLSGVNAQGQAVQGQAVSLATTNGIANVLFRAGSQPGIVQLRVTADGADNNVDNGIIDAVTGLRPIIVSDGRLFSLRIASPRINTIRVNRVDPSVEFNGDPVDTPDPDGTYSLTVSVIGTDRGGNPVLPGTPIQFGLIDAPVVGFPDQGSGFFAISGTDGNPEEGGQRFTAPGGQFQTAGGGAGPGDTLVVFGKEVPGNRDLESARTVAQVLSQTELRVTQRFNRNDDSGSSVDFGPVLPYVVGRAVDGNITTDRLTNEIGVATTKMNYPVSRLGKSVIVWARGAGDLAGGGTELVTDTAFFVYPGVAPGLLTAGPSPLPRGRTSPVTICISDALRHPIQGIFVDFLVVNAGDFVRVDGQPRQGTVTQPTGASGCTVAEVEVGNFLTPDPNEPSRIVFSGAGLSDEVLIAEPLEAILQVQPQMVLGDRGSPGQLFDLRLIDITGAPISGAQLTVECTASNNAILNIVQFPGITDSQGRTTARIIAENLDQFNGSGSGSCVFSTRVCPTGCTASATVTFTGRDLCEFAGGGGGFSPPPPPGFVDPCADAQPPAPPEQATIFIGAQGPANSGVISIQPGGDSAVASPGGSVTSATYPVGSLVFISAAPNTAAGFCFAGWQGNACQTQSNQNLTVSLNVANVNPAQSCIAVFQAAATTPAPFVCP